MQGQRVITISKLTKDKIDTFNSSSMYVNLLKFFFFFYSIAVRAQGVLKLLRSLLERFPSSSSVRAAITALTAIAADTVVHVPDQVCFCYFLIDYGKAKRIIMIFTYLLLEIKFIIH